MNLICCNGIFSDADKPVLQAQNRSFKYGDGVFETMRLRNGKLLLKELHFDRLINSLQLLQIKFSSSFIEEITTLITELSKKNNCLKSARIRMAVFREDDNSAGYLIEATPLQNGFYGWNEKGWKIEIYLQAKKATDAFSVLKSANYLPYVMVGLGAKELGVDECLVLNTAGNIADGSKTNVFIIKDGTVFTPALTEGCVSGVMRQHLIGKLKNTNHAVVETQLKIEDVQTADEVFLTNAIIGVQWVQSFQKKDYGTNITQQIFKNVILSLNS